MELQRHLVTILDDDPTFGGQLARYLERHGLVAEHHSEVGSFFQGIEIVVPDIVVLDQMLGVTTGLEVLRQIRSSCPVPVVMLTGLDDHVDRVVGLESGADDYIGKSATPREILARLRAVLRRNGALLADPSPRFDIASPPAAPRGAWHFSLARRQLHRPDGAEIHLTSAEFELLRALFENKGAVCSRASLSATVLGRPYRPDDRSIDTLVAKLRRKLEPDPNTHSMIKSVRPHGYVFVGFEGDDPLQ
jgi:DNA-binding response OmpR family regulator